MAVLARKFTMTSAPARVNTRLPLSCLVTRLIPKLVWMLIWLLSVSAAFAAPAGQRWGDVERVVAFGDVHGANDALIELLRYLDVIDDDDRWAGGRTHLVSLGDLLDRGPDSRAAMDLLIRLQSEAEAAGGRVHVVLGNHEVMNLTGDLRYVSREEYAAFAGEETQAERQQAFATMREAGRTVAEDNYPPGYFAHRRAFAADGRYGSWLLSLPAVVIVNDSAFAHGGFPDWMNEYTLDDINNQVSDDLSRLLATGAELRNSSSIPHWEDLLDIRSTPTGNDDFKWLQESPFLGNEGPLWYRGNAHCHVLIETNVVKRALANFDVKRLVVGHSPTSTRRIQQRFDSAVILADTGMLNEYYRGQPAALVQDADGLSFAYPDDGQWTKQASAPFTDQQTVLPLEDLEAFMSELDYDPQGKVEPVVFGGRRFQPVFNSGNKRTNSSRVAAFRFDQLLGLGMVPPTIERKIGGRSGTLTLLPAQVMSESQRAEEGVYRPQYCLGTNDYQLMYAFDALIRNNNRTPDTMLYDRRNWSLILTLEENAFTTSTTLPDYLKKVPATLPESLAAKLNSLSFETLQATLSPVLSTKQVRAIDARRQKLLEQWRIGV
jgi:calcineurin-like phosphoesterase family protein